MTSKRYLILSTLVAILIATMLLSCQYSTGTTLDTQLFPHSQYWSIAYHDRNVLCLTTYNPSVWYLAVGDTITVSYVDNR